MEIRREGLLNGPKGRDLKDTLERYLKDICTLISDILCTYSRYNERRFHSRVRNKAYHHVLFKLCPIL